eukprot:289676_1
MNLRKNSRIQQAPTTMASPTIVSFPIPESVEFIQGRQQEGPSSSKMIHSRPSQPIPIKKRRPSPQELEEDVHSADSSSHYDWATWRMYERITNARRIRAVSRNSCPSVDADQQEQSQPVVISDEHFRLFALKQALRVHTVTESCHGLLQPALVDEFEDDGVFVLDAM